MAGLLSPAELDRLMNWMAVLAWAGSLPHRERKFCAAMAALSRHASWQPTLWQVMRMGRIVRGYQDRLDAALRDTGRNWRERLAC